MILASQSPRRRELLGLFCPEFEVMPAQGEESLPDGISPREAVMLLSKQKAEEISARKFPDGNITDTIIAADTIDPQWTDFGQSYLVSFYHEEHTTV